MKRCTKCERLLPIKEFNKNKSTKGGLQSWCRACEAAYNAVYNSEHKAEKAVYNAVYRQSPRGKAVYRAADVRRRAKHPQRERCRSQLRHAIRDGKIIRQPCINGCKAKAEGHHSDYTKPFDVDWLCPECHRAWHAANK